MICSHLMPNDLYFFQAETYQYSSQLRESKHGHIGIGYLLGYCTKNPHSNAEEAGRHLHRLTEKQRIRQTISTINGYIMYSLHFKND